MTEETRKMFRKIMLDFFNVRSFITLSSFIMCYWLIIQSKQVPDWLIALVNLLQGFWFGQKVNQARNKTEELT